MMNDAAIFSVGYFVEACARLVTGTRILCTLAGGRRASPWRGGESGSSRRIFGVDIRKTLIYQKVNQSAQKIGNSLGI